MAITTHPQVVQVHVDPYSFLAEIQVLSGNPVQNYNKDTDKYEPDRALVPCLLAPYVSVQDPEGVMNGSQPITGAEWYEGAPKADGSNRIIASTPGYVISDTGTPTYSLKVKKNIDYNSPVELHCLFYFTDKRKNTQESVERSIVLRTSLFDSNNYSVKTDSPKGITINPLEVTPDSKGRWAHTISSQLYSGSTAVADANAAYWWQILDGTNWRDFTAEELDLLVISGRINGIWSKAITLDTRFLRSCSIRVRACYYTGNRPSAPSSEETQAINSIKVEMPGTLRVDTVQTKGVRLRSDMKTPVGYEARIYYNAKTVPASKYDLFRLEWFAQSSAPGSAPLYIGYGRTMEFIPANFGFDIRYPTISIYAVARLYAVTALVTRNGKQVLKDNKVLTAIKFE